MADQEQPDLTSLTVELLCAYLGNHRVPTGELDSLIRSTHAALGRVAAGPSAAEASPPPAVSLRRSLASPDHILSMIDGRPYKLLKRHLAQHGLTPGEYRRRYGLPADYPMVARGYSEARRLAAAQSAFGKESRKDGAVAAPAEVASAAAGAPAAAPARASEDIATKRELRKAQQAAAPRTLGVASPAEPPSQADRPRRRPMLSVRFGSPGPQNGAQES